MVKNCSHLKYWIIQIHYVFISFMKKGWGFPNLNPKRISNAPKKSGSVKFKVLEGQIIVYQHLLHALKALVPVQISIPLTVGSLVKTMSVLKKLVKELKFLDQSILSEMSGIKCRDILRSMMPQIWQASTYLWTAFLTEFKSADWFVF